METFNELIAGDKPVLVDFFATWCKPCQMMSLVFEEVKATLGDRIHIVKIDIDKQQDIADQYRVQSVPTLMIFRNGEQLWRNSGYMPRTEVLAAIDPFLDKQ
jgi:thioredoxin 1